MNDDVYTYVKTCPDCNQKTKVTDVREQDNGIVTRTRKCTKCGFTFRTIEIEDFMIDTTELLEKIRILEKRIEDIKKVVSDF